MFVNLSKNSREEKRGPSRLHPKRPIIKKSCFIDHNDYTANRSSTDHRVKLLTPDQVARISERLKIK